MAEEKGWVELIWDGKRERFVSNPHSAHFDITYLRYWIYAIIL